MTSLNRVQGVCLWGVWMKLIAALLLLQSELQLRPPPSFYYQTLIDFMLVITLSESAWWTERGMI